MCPLPRAGEPAPDPPAAGESLDALFELLYDDLRRVAHNQLRAEDGGHTLNTTALVNESWLRLAKQAKSHGCTEGQLFALAARAMRRVLVDYARRHRALRRGGGVRPLALDVLPDGASDASPPEAPSEEDLRAEEMLALDAALERLEGREPRLSRVVELRFYGGRTEVQIAELLGVTERTVRRDWVRAREWLYAEVRAQVP
jgi:RNA polymerase sigma factor (TIGR02999 family)